MSHIQGIKVDLQITQSDGSKDRLYLGVVGTGGGREFPLYNHHFEDSAHIAKTAWQYRLGEIWDEVVLPGDPPIPGSQIFTDLSIGNQTNDPRRERIELRQVDRDQGKGSSIATSDLLPPVQGRIVNRRGSREVRPQRPVREQIPHEHSLGAWVWRTRLRNCAQCASQKPAARSRPAWKYGFD